MGQLHYYKLGKCCYNLGQLLKIRATVLQNRAAITNWDKIYYKLGQVLKIRAINTNWGIIAYKFKINLTLNSDRGISDFQISGQSLIKENYQNSRTSDNIDMELGPVTKTEKRKKTTSKKIDNDVMSENCDVIVIFPNNGQFGAIQKPDSRCIVCKTCFH